MSGLVILVAAVFEIVWQEMDTHTNAAKNPTPTTTIG